MQVGDGDRVKKKKRKKESTVDEGGKERQRGREAVELNRIGPTAWCGVFAGSSSKDICSAYVCTYIYIYIYVYGTFGDSASVGCNENEGRGYKAPDRDEARGACEY